MAKSNLPSYTKDIRDQRSTIVNSDGTSQVNIFTAGMDDSIIFQISAATDNTVDLVLFLHFWDGSGSSPIGWCLIPAGSGTNGQNDNVPVIASVTFNYRKIDNNANPFVELAKNNSIRASVQTAVEATKTLWLTVSAQDY